MEASEAVDALQAELNELDNANIQAHKQLHACYRWRLAVLLVLLNNKRRLERRARARAEVVNWLIGKKEGEATLVAESLNRELDDARRQLSHAHAESDALRGAAATIASAKIDLEAQQVRREELP